MTASPFKRGDNLITQFVGGETARETFPILAKLGKQGTGTLLAYSVEVHEQDGEATHETDQHQIPSHKIHIAEIVRSIDAAAEFEAQNRVNGLPASKTWTAVKLTALLPDAESIERLSTYLCKTQASSSIRSIPFPHSPTSKDLAVLSERTPPAPLTVEDIESIKELYGDLKSICIKAKQQDVTLVFDAEHTW